MTGRAGLENTGSNTRRLYRIGAQLWSICSAGLSRSGERTWWEEATYQASIPFDVEMAYECDNDLGSPVLNDCSDIQINQLGPPSDTVSVGPGNTQFLHSSRQHQPPQSSAVSRVNNLTRFVCHGHLRRYSSRPHLAADTSGARHPYECLLAKSISTRLRR